MKFPASPYNGFLDRIRAKAVERVAKVPPYKEDPVLPPIRSTVSAPYSNNAVLLVGQRGVSLMDNVLRAVAKPDAPWQPDWAADAKLVDEVSRLVQDVRSTTASAFNQSQIFVVPEATVPVGYLEAILRATIVGEQAKQWFTVILVGRRREDGTNRRAGFNVSILAKDKQVPFKLNSPAGKALQCAAWGVIGKDVLEAKGFQSLVFHDGAKVHTARLAVNGALSGVQSAEGHGEGPRLESWADAQSGSIVVAVPASATYAQWLEALNGVALKCAEAECQQARMQPVFVATCR